MRRGGNARLVYHVNVHVHHCAWEVGNHAATSRATAEVVAAANYVIFIVYSLVHLQQTMMELDKEIVSYSFLLFYSITCD